ncbi:MAG: TetR/AcrR family transcriptional regulator [Sedimentisphaerales bacterium]|nr:TetR/AcrR family transcriptional regulator [Sedimentisphaerales bacterium]
MPGLDTENAPNLTKEAKVTMQRLLNAAEELFAQKGFDGTTIRDITTKAKRNTAAINYFFGDKQVLYEELFRRRLREMRETRLKSIKAVMSDKNKPDIEKLLKSYAVAFLEPFTDSARNKIFMQLFARELVEQQLPKTMFIEEMAAPVMSALEEALSVVCPTLQKQDCQMCIHSLIGQLIHIVHINAMFEGIQANFRTNFDLEEAINHIVNFSVAGIRALAKGNQK